MSTHTDNTAPMLISLTLPEQIDLSAAFATLAVSATAADDLSGVDDLVIRLDREIAVSDRPGSDSYTNASLLGLYSDLGWADGSAAEIWGIAPTNPLETVNVTSVELVDMDGNARTYSAADLELMGINTSIEIARNLWGDGADNELNGGAYAEDIRGRAGNDTIKAGGGDDKIYGGSGLDFIFAEDGRDIVAAGPDNDEVYGGVGDDKLYGSSGDDLIYGEAGADVVAGQSGADDLFGGEGNDKLFGGTSNDRLEGDEGNDILSAGAGDDVLSGGDGADRLYGSTGDDILDGGAGNDRLRGESHGQEESDRFVFAGQSFGDDVVFNFDAVGAEAGGADLDQDLIMFQNTDASDFADLQVIDSGDDVIIRIAGQDDSSVTLRDVATSHVDEFDFFFA